MALDDLMTILDMVFAVMAVLCLLVVRFRPMRTYERLIDDLDALIATRAGGMEDGNSLRQLALVARQMEVVPRAAVAVNASVSPSVTAVIRGRRGRLDLLSNFFVRSRALQERIDHHLAELRSACAERRRQAAGGYMSPFNPLNLPSSLACYLGLDLKPSQMKALDGVAWALAGAMAGTVALRV